MLWLALSSFAAEPDDDPLLDALRTELDRTTEAWADKDDPPYYLAYRVLAERGVTVSARFGALSSSTEWARRDLDVTARVGTYELDNTHPIRGRRWDLDRSRYSYARLALDADATALRSVIWRYTDSAIREARDRILEIRANKTVKVEEADASDDFSRIEAVVDVKPLASVTIDRAAWEPVVVRLSDLIDEPEFVLDGTVSLDARAQDKYIVTNEGTVIREPRVWVRLSMWASALADDGEKVSLYRWRDVHDPANLPDDDELEQWAEAIRTDLGVLRAAERGTPYSGPLLLRGRAAGVFIHEVIGHRVEGHRQKDEDEGQTFKDYVGKTILPETISIWDDPTLERYAEEDLNGHYHYDEEGVAAKRATLVDKGVFTGFLMSRSPIEGFAESNGHGRAASYARPVARMANTVVETSDPVPFEQLRAKLIEEVKAQGREYGVLVDEIAGGFTLTGRIFPNAFNVRAGTAWLVYADGRPDEMIRGIDLVGTPLIALGSVVAAGDDPGVFNGFCGAESGAVPNSAISPSLLLRELEVQRKEKGHSRPPILPRPDDAGEDS